MVIAVADIQRWVQPAPTRVQGEAIVFPDATCDVVVVGSAVGPVVLAPAFPVAVDQAGVAPIQLFGEVLLLSSLLGSASVGFDNTGFADDATLTSAVATVSAVAAGLVSIDAFGVAYGLVLSDFRPLVPQVGSAEVALADYGQGSVPVFPFSLPTQFTDGRNDKDAIAYVSITGSGVDVGVGGFADATFTLDGTAPGVLKGMVSVLPYRFPAIFDNSYSGQVGYAEVFVTGSGSQVVSVNAESVVNIAGASDSLSTAVLPFKFPTVFFEPYQLGAAQVVCDGVSPAFVEVSGDAVVSVAAEMWTIEITRFPFRLPARFINV